MTKSNGIKSLKQAAKLLNKHAPEGESLAYINPDEGRLLKAHGGSGIMTLQGVPTYGPIWEFAKKFVPDAWEPALETIGTGIQSVGKFLGYGDKEIPHPDQDKYPGRTITQPGRSIVNDALSVWGALRAKKDQEGLNAAEMEQFNKLNQQLAAAETEFDVSTDFGQQLKPEYETDITKSAAYTPITFDAAGATTPDLTIDAKAYGGRIGYNMGGIDTPFQGIGALNPRMGYQNAGEVENFNWGGPDVVETANIREEALFNDPLFDRDIQALEKEHTGKFEDLVAQEKSNQRKRMHMALEEYQDMAQSNNLYDALKIARSMGDTEFVNFWSEYTPSGDQSVENPGFSTASGALGAAQGGRIGYENAGEVNPEKNVEKFLEDLKRQDLHKFLDKYRRWQEHQEKDFGPGGQWAAQGGRIGAQKGGIMPLLDMGGMEKDYRQDGGFVPIGRKEKADDVPARLSKNEFVFTADAVRAAGGGDIDQGAQRMYNVMKNLEAGGEISEQSQGQG